MPCDRRRFLALSGASLGAGPWLPAWTRPLPALHVLFEPAVAASAGFAAALPARSCIAIDLDQPLALMHAIGERLTRGEQLVACTREAARFISAELLRQGGYRQRAVAEHRRDGRAGWQHTVTAGAARGDDALLDTLQPLWRAGAGTTADAVFAAASGPAYLVTWIAEAA